MFASTTSDRFTPLRVAVLGAAGTIAPAIVHDLAASPEVQSMLLLDLDTARAERVAEQHGGGRSVAKGVDARAVGELAAALDGIDVLVNTASYRVNLDAMRECLAARCNYLDLGGLYWMTTRQLELGPEFERAGLLAVLGIGSSPGKTNLMAAHAVARLDAEAEEIASIEIMAAGRDPAAGEDGALRPPYALQTLLDELTLEPVVIRDGKAMQVDPLQSGGIVDFGEPIGPAETIFTLHSELATFPSSFRCRNASFRLSLSATLLSRLKELVGAASEEVAAAARSTAAPSTETVSVHLARARSRGGRSVTVRAVTRPHFGLGGSIVSTAAPAAATVRLLARGAVTAVGVHPPELCLDPVGMFAELEQRGCAFSVE